MAFTPVVTDHVSIKIQIGQILEYLRFRNGGRAFVADIIVRQTQPGDPSQTFGLGQSHGALVADILIAEIEMLSIRSQKLFDQIFYTGHKNPFNFPK